MEIEEPGETIVIDCPFCADRTEVTRGVTSNCQRCGLAIDVEAWGAPRVPIHKRTLTRVIALLLLLAALAAAAIVAGVDLPL